jgi:hypothetical protein
LENLTILKQIYISQMLEDFFLLQNLTQSIAAKYNGLERKKKSKQHRDPQPLPWEAKISLQMT